VVSYAPRPMFMLSISLSIMESDVREWNMKLGIKVEVLAVVSGEGEIPCGRWHDYIEFWS